MKEKMLFLILPLIVFIGIYSCEKENDIKDTVIFYDDFSDLNYSNKIWDFIGLAEISNDDSLNYYLSISSDTERGMGHSNAHEGKAYCNIHGLEYNQMIFELSFNALIESDDGPTSIKLSHIKKDTSINVLTIYENYTNNWKNYDMIDTIFNIRNDDTLKITLHNHAGFTNGTFISKFDNIKLIRK